MDSSHAVATWINDPDGDDSIPGNRIMNAYYDGNVWSDPVPITAQDDHISYRELAMDFNAGYGALAYTYTDYSDTINTRNKLSVEIYDIATTTWRSADTYDFEDSTSDVRLPRITISKGGIVAASFQAVKFQTDTNFDANHGSINLVAKNLVTGSNWTVINSQLISDSSILTWDMDLAFGSDNNLYTLSHEIDTIPGNFYRPKTGVLFGNPEISLVLRGLHFTDALTTDSLAQDSLPLTPTGLTPMLHASSDKLTLKVYPNPFIGHSSIEYYIPEAGYTTLEIFDIMGRSIALPLNGVLEQGAYKTYFEPLRLEAGIYIIRLTSGVYSAWYKLIKE